MRRLVAMAACLCALAAWGGATAQADVPAPAAPTGLQAANVSGATLLTWKPSPEPFVYGYEIQRKLEPSGTFAYLTETWTLAHRDTTVVRGSTYSYRIVAQSVTGADSSPSGERRVTAAADTTPPAALTSTEVAASAQSGGIWVGFTARDDPTVTGYGLLRREVGVDVNPRWWGTFPVDEDRFLDEDVVAGRTYEYKWWTQDAAHGFSGDSYVVSATPGADTTAPATPTGLSAHLGDAEVQLVWTRNAEVDVTTYEVQGRRCAASTWIDWGDAEDPRFLAKWLVNDASYCFRVRALDDTGNASGWTSSVSATPDRALLELGVVGGGTLFSDAGHWTLLDDLGEPDTRFEAYIGDTPARLADEFAVFESAGVRPLLLAGFDTTAYPSERTVEDFCGGVAAHYGPGGTAGLPDESALRHIEFGNESSYSYRHTNLKDRPEVYAARLNTCIEAAAAANPFVGVLGQADGPVSAANWVDTIYSTIRTIRGVDDLNERIAGWTTHPYGPPYAWEPLSFHPYTIERAVAKTARNGSTAPMYATEFGIATDDGAVLSDNYQWPVDMTYAEAEDALVDSLVDFKATYPRLSQLHYYTLRDSRAPGVSTDREHYFGLTQVDFTRKATLYPTFRALSRRGGY